MTRKLIIKKDSVEAIDYVEDLNLGDIEGKDIIARLTEDALIVKGEFIESDSGVYIKSNNALVPESLGNVSRIISIDHTKIDEDLEDYPVMVKLTADNFNFSEVENNGTDIYFVLDDGMELDFEREYFSKDEQLAIFHVRIPEVSSAEDTVFFIKTDADEDKENAEGVWDSNFVMVQHMGESLVDSTGNGNDGTNYGTTVIDGLNGKARSFDGVNDYINLPSFGTLFSGDNNYTTNIIYNQISGGRQQIFSIRNGHILQYQTGENQDNNVTHLRGNLGSWQDIVVSSPHSYGVYNNLSMNYSNATGYSLFENSTLKDTNSNTGDVGTETEMNRLGAQGGTADFYFNGIIDEVRISNIARSDAWIKADDYNLRQNNLITISEAKGGNFYAPEFVGKMPPIVKPYYGDGSLNNTANGYTDKIYTSLDPTNVYTGKTAYRSGNWQNLLYAFFTDEAFKEILRRDSPLAHRINKVDSPNYGQQWITSGTKDYIFTEPATDIGWLVLHIEGGAYTTSFSVGSLKLQINGSFHWCADAISLGLIEPLILIGSGSDSGNYLFPNAEKILTGTTGTGNYPTMIIFIKPISNITGVQFYANKSASNNPNYSDGFHALQYESEDLEFSLEPFDVIL